MGNCSNVKRTDYSIYNTNSCNSTAPQRGCKSCYGRGNTVSKCLGGNCSQDCIDSFESTDSCNNCNDCKDCNGTDCTNTISEEDKAREQRKHDAGATLGKWQSLIGDKQPENVDMNCSCNGCNPQIYGDGVNDDKIQPCKDGEGITGVSFSNDNEKYDKLSDFGDVIVTTDSLGEKHYFMPPSQKDWEEAKAAGKTSLRWTELTGGDIDKKDGGIVSPDDNDKGSGTVSPDDNEKGSSIAAPHIQDDNENPKTVVPDDQTNKKDDSTEKADTDTAKAEDEEKAKAEAEEAEKTKSEEDAKEQCVNNTVDSIQKHFQEAGKSAPTRTTIESAVKSEISRLGVNFNNNQALNPFIVQKIINNLTKS